MTSVETALRVSVTCPRCSKTFEDEADGEAVSGDESDLLEATIDHVQTRLGQHLWSSHNIDSGDISDVEPKVSRIAKRNKPSIPKPAHAAAHARSRSPRPAQGTQVPQRQGGINLFLASVQINLAELSDARLLALKFAVERELVGRGGAAAPRHGNQTQEF
jgi:hypothetical protein